METNQNELKVYFITMPSRKICLAERVQSLTLLLHGVPIDEICAKMGCSKSSLYQLKKRALSRGFNPDVSPILHDEYLVDAPKSGRPKISDEKEDEIKAMRAKYGDELSQRRLASEVGISTATVARVLKRKGPRSENPDHKKQPKVGYLIR